MAARKSSHYDTLGVPAHAAPNELREAYRRLARQCHPDVARSESSRRFCEITEAYEVLSDPARRAAYDREQRQARGVTPDRGAAAPPPIRPNPAIHPNAAAGQSWFGRDRWPAAEPLCPPPRGRAPLHAAQPVRLVVRLTPAATRRSHTFRLMIPVVAPCPTCRGSGGAWTAGACMACRGSGSLVREVPVDLRLPPGTADNMLLRRTLVGVHPPVDVEILVRVTRSP